MAVIYALLRVRLNNVQSKLFVHKKYSNHRRNRHYFSANGPFLLLPLALKWGLFLLLAMVIVPCLSSKGVSAASLTLDIPTNPLTVNASATVTNGFAEASGKVSVKGEAYWGYTLTIKAENGSNDLVSKEDEANKIASITEEVSKTNFPDNSWGYKFGRDTANIDSDNFKAGPIGEAQIDKTNTSGQHNYTFTIGAKVDENQPAGIYSNTFIFTAVTNAVNYKISYDEFDSGVDGVMDTGSTTEPNITLRDASIAKKHYTFKGWCKKDVENGGCADTKVYAAGNDFPLENGTNETTLLGVWELANDQQYMQNFKCSSLSLGSEKTLVDARDDKMYTVAKLKDGKCWMTQNFRFGDNDLVTRELTPIESDLHNRLYTISKSNPAGFSNSVEDAADLYVDSVYDGFYTWYAAIAGSKTSKSEAGTNAADSICPKGWRLPEGGTQNEFRSLAIIYGYESVVASNGETLNGSALIQSPVNLSLYGSYENSKHGMLNSGLYWTSTVSAFSLMRFAYDAIVSNTNMSFKAIGDWAVHGYSVRCIARE